MTFHWAGGNHFVIAMRELLADFDFQCCRVNFYKLKRVVARLIDSIRYVGERKNLLGQLCLRRSRDVTYFNLPQCASSIHTYLYAALCTIAALAKQNVFVCCLGVFCDLWKNTSLHATLEKNLLSCCVALYHMEAAPGYGR